MSLVTECGWGVRWELFSESVDFLRNDPVVNIIAADGSLAYITIKLSLAIASLNKILCASRLQDFF